MPIAVVPEKPTKGLNPFFSTEKGVIEIASNQLSSEGIWQKIKRKITKAKSNLFRLPMERVINQ